MLNWILGRKRTVVVDVAREFGERLTWKEVGDAMRNQGGGGMYRAMGQMLACQMAMNVRAVQDKSNVVGGQTAYEAGAAACAAEVLGLLVELEKGECGDAELRRWFGE